MEAFLVKLKNYHDLKNEEVKKGMDYDLELYEYYSKCYSKLKTKKFYSYTETFFVAVEEYNAAIKEMENNCSCCNSDELEEIIEEIKYYKSEEGFEDLVENTDIILFPSYLLEQEV